MKTRDIILTDVQLHIQRPRKPQTLLRKVLKYLRSGKPERAYSTELKTTSDDGTFEFVIPLSEEDRRRLERGEIRLSMPKGGIPIFAGKDLIEYAKAHPEKLKGLDR